MFFKKSLHHFFSSASACSLCERNVSIVNRNTYTILKSKTLALSGMKNENKVIKVIK